MKTISKQFTVSTNRVSVMATVISTVIAATRVTPLILALLITSSCSWVKVSEQGKNVAILPASRVMDCQQIGKVSTSVKDRIIGIERNQEKIQTELDRLAQDQAVLINANSLVRVSINDGAGVYIAYRCPVNN